MPKSKKTTAVYDVDSQQIHQSMAEYFLANNVTTTQRDSVNHSVYVQYQIGKWDKKNEPRAILIQTFQNNQQEKTLVRILPSEVAQREYHKRIVQQILGTR